METVYIRLSTIVLSIFVGVALSILARYLRVPAIAPLLIGGVILGPEVLGFVDTKSLGEGLRLIIGLSVATILFEGGLTLEASGFKKAKGVISRLLTFGVLITWFGTAVCVYFLFDFSIPMSLLAGSLIIVTGPTVITPLLQRIKIKEKLHHILHWEGVLIDPIGVFIAILCFEWLSIQGSFAGHLGQFGLRMLIGIGIGALGGYFIYWLLQRRWIPEDQANIFVLAAALFLYGVSDFLVHEAGILTVVVAGFILGLKKPARLKDIHRFKAELTELAIAILFILLSANLQLNNFIELGWRGIILIALALFLIRPLSIAVSTYRSAVSLRERLFLCWLAPRGVVAGSMASLFALELSIMGEPNAAFLEAFTFSVIGFTIIVQGLLSRPVAKILGVKAPPQEGWLIIGAHFFARKVATFIGKTTGKTCVLVDTNADAVRSASAQNLLAFQGNALSVETVPDEYRTMLGNVIALTDNRDLNQLICEKWSEFVKRDRLFRWSTPESEPDGRIKALGTPIWTSLPKPSIVAYDLQNRESVLIRSRIEQVESRSFADTIPLMSFQDDQLKFHSFEWSGEGEALLFHQLSHHLPFFVRRELIWESDTDQFEKLLANAIQRAAAIQPEIPQEKTMQLLIKREREMPTVLRHGVAVPHTHCDGLKEPLCMVIRVSRGIELSAFDKERSCLFFVLLSPANDPKIHLTLLGDIARLASDVELVEKLLSANIPDEFLTVLVEAGGSPDRD